MLMFILLGILNAPLNLNYAHADNRPEITGTVLETIDTKDYTYLRVKTPTGETWAAVPLTPMKKGKQVTLLNPLPMNGFESKTLKRKFDQLVFATLKGAEQKFTPSAAAAPSPGKLPAGHPKTPSENGGEMHNAAAATDAEIASIKVIKAEGPDARTIAETYAQKAALKDKPVTLKGKVVKFTSSVMKSNWLHLRDGSGTVAGANFDITVSTATEKEMATVGDTVTIKGIVRTNKDFGAGYNYPVMVDGAQISK